MSSVFLDFITSLPNWFRNLELQPIFQSPLSCKVLWSGSTAILHFPPYSDYSDVTAEDIFAYLSEFQLSVSVPAYDIITCSYALSYSFLLLIPERQLATSDLRTGVGEGGEQHQRFLFVRCGRRQAGPPPRHHRLQPPRRQHQLVTSAPHLRHGGGPRPLPYAGFCHARQWCGLPIYDATTP